MDIVLFGTGQFAEVAESYLQDSPYNIVAYTLDVDFIDVSERHGKPIVPFEQLTTLYPPEQYHLFIPISYKKMNQFREQKYLQAKAWGYQFISYVSPHARVHPNVTIGENCMILDDNVIQPYVTIGDNCILWSGNHIGHHTTIGDHCFLASHVVVSGSVTVGNNCFFGVNATTRDNIQIAEHNLIGAGALILENTEPKQVYVGVKSTPLRVTSDRVKNI